MRALLIADKTDAIELLESAVRRILRAETVRVNSIQAAIEFCELQEQTLDLVVCDYRGGSFGLVQMLVEVLADLPCVVVDEPDSRVARDLAPAYGETIFLANRDRLEEALPEALERLKTSGVLSRERTPDSDFVRINPRTLARVTPIQSDVYVRLSPDRYVKLFKQGDNFTNEDMETYLDKRRVDYFYIRRTDSGEILERSTDYLSKLESADVTQDQAREAVSDSLEVVQDIVEKLGFTPEAQEIARKSAQITLKVIGNDPKLSEVVKRLKQHEGRYITSHSIMLAEIACAIAHAIGWRSSGTYLKLTLAALMHDLGLQDSHLARVRALEGNDALGLSRHDLTTVRMHPLKSAELCRTFREIPPDVDHIILQHHERPDGTGFPRNLHYQHIHPLAGLFIISEDLLHFFLDQHRADGGLEEFLEARRNEYRAGTFKKITNSLRTGEPLT